jgi:hypothetical protein
MPVFRAALALSGSYYLAAKLGFALTPPGSPFSMVWLPNALLLAARRLGGRDTRLYDGSWSEWGADPATPKASGPA